MLMESSQDKLTAFKEVPVVDISPAGDPVRRAALAAEMVRVAQQVGFMYIVGHGIEPKVVDGVFEMSKRFFDLPEEEKRKIHITTSKAYRGYLGLLEKGNDPTFKGNNLEAFHCAEEAGDGEAETPLRGRNLWPERPDGFREVVYSYWQRAFGLGSTMLELLAEGLGQPKDIFLKHYKRSLSQLRLLRYAQIDDPNVHLLARAHLDTGVITILAQDPTGGLEVLNKDGEWISAPPVEGSFIINIGRTMETWSGGQFTATRHRVVNRGGVPRFSIPFFMTPSFDTVVTPLDVEVSEKTPTFHVGIEQRLTYQRIWPPYQQAA